MSRQEEFDRAGLESLERVTTQLESLGLRYSSMPPWALGAGVAVGWEDAQFVTLSILYADPNTLLITAGVLKEIGRDLTAILSLCNLRNQNNPAYCFFLHDAEVAWDILLQLSFPLQLLLDVPPFFEATLRPTAQVADEARDDFIALGLGGLPYMWTEEDRMRLLTRSMA